MTCSIVGAATPQVAALIRRTLGVALCVAILGLAGCEAAKPEGTVSGKVTYKGSPLASGTVNFHASDKGTASQANLDSNGAFKLPGTLPAGNYKVFVLPPVPQQLPPGTAQPKVDFNLPPKFQDLGQTPVTKEVKAGSNEFTIDLAD